MAAKKKKSRKSTPIVVEVIVRRGSRKLGTFKRNVPTTAAGWRNVTAKAKEMGALARDVIAAEKRLKG